MWFFRVLWKRIKIGAECAHAVMQGKLGEVMLDQVELMLADEDFTDLDVLVHIWALVEQLDAHKVQLLADLVGDLRPHLMWAVAA